MLGAGKIPYAEAIPRRKVAGRNLRIIVPHNWEFQGVEPLISRLRQEFNVWAVETPDSRSGIAEASRRLTAAKFGKEYDHPRAALFKLQDVWLRLKKLNAMLAEDPDSAVLELHCMKKDNHKWDGFVWEDYYFRIKGTWIIMPHDVVTGGYAVPLNDTLDLLWHGGAQAGALVPCFPGLDVREVRLEKDGELESLRKQAHRVAMLEMPVKKRRHSPGQGVDSRTDFEERHLCWQSAPVSLKEEEFQVVFGLFECHGRRRW